MIVVDHNEPKWAQARMRSKRTNGAYTYSLDILKWQLPIWNQILPDDAVISTAPALHTVDLRRAPVAVQYLHAYDNSPEIAARVVRKQPNTIFVTAYQDMEQILRDTGFRAVYVPMTIDRDTLPLHQVKEHGHKRILYFGNVIGRKRKSFGRFLRQTTRLGWTVDVLSADAFNGQPVDRDQTLAVVGKYNYGAGVGRCALEMGALGLRVLVYGGMLGGVILDEQDALIQTSTNFNGRYTTGGRTLIDCFRLLRRTKPYTNTIQDWLPFITEQIHSAA